MPARYDASTIVDPVPTGFERCSGQVMVGKCSRADAGVPLPRRDGSSPLRRRRRSPRRAHPARLRYRAIEPIATSHVEDGRSPERLRCIRTMVGLSTSSRNESSLESRVMPPADAVVLFHCSLYRSWFSADCLLDFGSDLSWLLVGGGYRLQRDQEFCGCDLPVASSSSSALRRSVEIRDRPESFEPFILWLNTNPVRRGARFLWISIRTEFLCEPCLSPLLSPRADSGHVRPLIRKDASASTRFSHVGFVWMFHTHRCWKAVTGNKSGSNAPLKQRMLVY